MDTWAISSLSHCEWSCYILIQIFLQTCFHFSWVNTWEWAFWVMSTNQGVVEGSHLFSIDDKKATHHHQWDIPQNGRVPELNVPWGWERRLLFTKFKASLAFLVRVVLFNFDPSKSLQVLASVKGQRSLNQKKKIPGTGMEIRLQLSLGFGLKVSRRWCQNMKICWRIVMCTWWLSPFVLT